MNKAVPWNIKGVGFDAREAARQAAKRVGLPVGRWLDSVIAERAADLGVRVDDIDPADRLEALAARLSELAESGAPRDEDSDALADPTPDARSHPNAVRGALTSGRLPNAAEDETENEAAAMNRNGLGDADEVYRAGDDDVGTLVRRSPRNGDAYRSATARHHADEGVREAPGSAGRRPAVERRGDRHRAADEVAVGSPDASAGETQRPLRDALGTMAERLNYLETRVAQRDVDVNSRPIVSALQRLESRFDNLARRGMDTMEDEAIADASFRKLEGRLSAISERLEGTRSWPQPRTHAEIERIDGKLATILARLNTAGSAVDSRDVWSRSAIEQARAAGYRMPDAEARANIGSKFRSAVAEIARRQADLDQPLAHKAALLNEASYPSIGQTQRVPRAEGDSATPDGQGLDAAFKALSERLEARLDQASHARISVAEKEASDLAALHQEISGLGLRLDGLQREGAPSQDGTQVIEGLGSLREDVRSLAQGIADLTERSSIRSLENAVRDLAGRVETSRLDGIADAVLAPVERLSMEIREAIQAMDPRLSTDGLEQRLGALTSRIESIDSRSFDSQALVSLQAQTRSLQDAVMVAANAPPFAERMERAIAQLGERLDHLTEMTPKAASMDLERSVADIRLMAERFAPEGFIDRLDQKIDRLAERLDHAVERHAPQAVLFDDLSRQIENAHASLAARLSARAEEAAPVDLRPIEAMIGGLSGKIDGLHDTSTEMRTLDRLIRGLMTQIEEARQPTPDARTLDSLESQVGRLAERLDRSDAGLTAISSLERAIGDLFQQLEETRNVAIDAAENAARTAAQDTLRAAMNSPALNGGELQLQTGLAVEQVSQDLSDFRQAQDASEKRVHGTLKALSLTLERLVDRMIGDLQPVPAAKASPQPKAPQPETKPAAPPAQPLPKAAPAKTERAVEVRLPEPPQPALEQVAAPLAEASAEPKDEPATLEVDAPLAVPTARRDAPSIEIGRPPSVDVGPDVSPLIAAARRAAQAAQATAAARPRPDAPVRERVVAADGSTNFFTQKRRPLLLGLAGVVLLLGALQIVKLTGSFHGTAPQPAAVVEGKPETKSDLSLDNKAADATASIAGDAASNAAGSEAAAKSKAPAESSAAVAVPDPVLDAFAAGLRDLAMRGNPAAQFEVAVRLADGRGVTRDLKDATVWFERAAKQGLAPAQYRLGSMYEKGLGVTADAAVASSWYERAATQGNVRAMHNLAVMSAEGSGAKPDYAKAATWFTKAANLGVRDSQYNLAILYARGLGVPPNLSQSYAWFSVAAAQGDIDAGKKRDEVAAKLDAKSLADAKVVVDAFHPNTPDHDANEVSPPAGGWDAVAPGLKGVPGAASQDKAHLKAS